MTNIEPQAESLSTILRSSHIFLIRVESSTPGPWIQRDGSPRREVRLQLRLEEILKGEVREPAGSIVPVLMAQTGRPGGRIYALPGVWSEHSIEPGTQLVAFSSGSTDRASVLLLEPSLKQLLPAAEALDDVRIAMDAERKRLPLSAIVDLAKSAAAKLDYTFAEYLSAKAETSLLASRDEFARLAHFVEEPALKPVVRATLVANISSTMTELAPAPTQFVSIWATTLIHVAGMPEAKDLSGNILTVYLPNLVGATGGAPKTKASDLFRNSPHDREVAERVAAANPGAEALRKWLRE